MDFYLFRSPHLVCGEQIVVFNDYDLNHHYETKHTEKYQKPNLYGAGKIAHEATLFTEIYTSIDGVVMSFSVTRLLKCLLSL